jgi:hypothetical protein
MFEFKEIPVAPAPKGKLTCSWLVSFEDGMRAVIIMNSNSRADDVVRKVRRSLPKTRFTVAPIESGEMIISEAKIVFTGPNKLTHEFKVEDIC